MLFLLFIFIFGILRESFTETKSGLFSYFFVIGYTAALQESTPYQGLAHAYNQMRSGLGHVTQSDYRKLAEVTNEKMMQALDRLGLKEYYVRIVVQGKQLLLDQFHDIVQRPEFQQIYVVTNEIYQQVYNTF